MTVDDGDNWEKGQTPEDFWTCSFGMIFLYWRVACVKLKRQLFTPPNKATLAFGRRHFFLVWTDK